MRRQPTWDDALRVAEKLLNTIEGSFMPDLVLGLGRSGGIWGGWLAGNLGSLPFAVIDIEYDDGEVVLRAEFPGGEEVLSSVRKRFPNSPHVLVVQGAASGGMTFREFFAKFNSQRGVKTSILEESDKQLESKNGE